MLDNPISLDIEHDEQGGFVGIGIGRQNKVLYFTEITPRLKEYLLNAHFVAHNGLSDIQVLQSWGIPVKPEQLVWDTLLLSHIIDSSRKQYGLKKLASEDLGVSYPSYDDIVGKRTAKQSKERTTLDKQPMELVAKYNACDVYFTYKLYEYQFNQIKSSDTIYFKNISKPVSNVFSAMEDRGISVNLEYLKGLKNDLEQQQMPIKASILAELGDINLNSPKQLLEALHAKEIYPTFKSKPSTDKRALEKERHKTVVESLLHFSELDTLLTSFVYPYLERNRTVVHPRFSQTGTRTGRPSCSNPNLLQIPRRTDNGKLVRRMFTARPGMLMGDTDYGQIEPRVLAHLSQDVTLCQLFNDSIDFHTYTAERLGISRERAKVLNLSVGYRATFKSVAQQLKCTDKEAQHEIDQWWGLFPSLRRWQESLIFKSKRSGTCETILGRRIRVDGLDNGNRWRREAAERQLINNITQGSAADIMLSAMVAIYKAYPEIGLLAQIYDELLFEAPANIISQVSDYVIDKMCNTTRLIVPLTVDGGIGENWANAKK